VAEVLRVARRAGATIVLELLLPGDLLESIAWLRERALVPASQDEATV
jgi:hypothetical protein